MADGYARATGRVGVCTATSGPGATNLVTGLATAHMDSIPIVAITGQVRTDVIGSDAFQEADATGCTRPVTKHNYLVKDVKDLARTVREAFHIASTGRPGPVHIDVPVDVQRAKTEFIWPKTVSMRSYSPTVKGHPGQIKKAAELMRQAERPLLYVGGGAVLSGASDLIRKLAEKADIPVVSTLMANGVMPFDHPLYMGPLGMHGKYSTNTAMQKCDLMISCGARFDDRVTGKLSTFAPNSKKIHFDIDPANIGKSVNVDVPVVGDLKNVLEELIGEVPANHHKSWWTRSAHGTNRIRSLITTERKYLHGLRNCINLQKRSHHYHGRGPAPDVGHAVVPVPQSPPFPHVRRIGHYGLRVSFSNRSKTGISE